MMALVADLSASDFKKGVAGLPAFGLCCKDIYFFSFVKVFNISVDFFQHCKTSMTNVYIFGIWRGNAISHKTKKMDMIIVLSTYTDNYQKDGFSELELPELKKSGDYLGFEIK